MITKDEAKVVIIESTKSYESGVHGSTAELLILECPEFLDMVISTAQGVADQFGHIDDAIAYASRVVALDYFDISI